MKRIVSMILALVMVLSMFAVANAEAATGMAAWTPFEETVTITVPVYDRSKAGYPAVDDNYWTQWIQKEFGDKWNIDVNYVAIPRGDVMTKYNLLIADKQTPTIMMEYDYPKVAQWATDGAMQTIELEKFAAVAPTYYGKMVENNQLGYTDINGETYFVLSERPYYNTNYTYFTFVRMDWLRAVGYDHVPATYEEHKDAINKIIQAGLTDQAPLGLGIPSAAYVANFAYHDADLVEAEWAQHCSLGTASMTWEPTKRLLKRTNDEYHMGWYSSEFDLDKNTAGAAADQMQTDFINGKIYQYGGYMASNVDWLKAFYDNNPGAELAIASAYAVEEEGVATARNRADNPFGMIVGFSSYATEDQLKAAWMLMEWMIQPENLFVLENGIEGTTYEMVDGKPSVFGDYMGDGMLNHNMNIDMTCLVHASKVVGTVEDSIKAVAPQGLPQDFAQAMIDSWTTGTKAIADRGNAYSDPIFAVAIESESEYSATLLSKWQEFYAKLVKCDPAEFDALYEQLSQEYLDAGYQEIIDERLEAYNNGQTTKLPQK
ncbi:MAG: extracellular solute-binding protein [Clostridia bacterium]|nr:extracellular solute-binding protein [Clostridia bacterium]